MTADFSQLGLHPGIVQAAADQGYKKPTEVQTRVIPWMLTGRDLLVQSQTGSGKTAAFAFPIIHDLLAQDSRDLVHSLVLAPTRELAIQVARAIKDYGQSLKVRVLPVYGGQNYSTSRRKLKQGVDVVVGTPGRLQDLMKQGILDISGIRMLILDEADEMLSMGFVEDVENILKYTPDQRQSCLFSATLPGAIRRLADRYLTKPETVIIKRQHLTVDSVDQRWYLINSNDKLAGLTRLLEYEKAGTTLVFTKTRKGSSKLAAELNERGYQAEALNGDLSQDARLRVLNRFRSDKIQVLVATDVASRGLDIDDITHIFNYDLPTDVEAYVHRIGRTGRAGKTGTAISLVTPRQQRYLQRIEGYTKRKMERCAFPTDQQLQERRDLKLMEQLEVWLERDRCRREQEIAQYLISSGYDPVKVAAAALKMARRAQDQNPLETISKVNSNLSHRKHHRSTAPAKISHEQGMVRLQLGKGRDHGLKPGVIVGGISSLARIPGSGIGRIIINKQNTLLDVREEYVPAVLKKSGSYHFKKLHHIKITTAEN